jgi:malate synthase
MYALNIENTCEVQGNTAVIGHATEFLDRTIPLSGASHSQVESYGVDIPMRYATLFAILTDGRKVRLRDARKFAGWSGWKEKRSFLFRNDDQHIEIQTDATDTISRMAPGQICDLAFDTTGGCGRKFISPDGSQLVL